MILSDHLVTKLLTCLFHTITDDADTAKERLWKVTDVRPVSAMEQAAWRVTFIGDTCSFQIFYWSLTSGLWFCKTSHVSFQSKGIHMHPFSDDSLKGVSIVHLGCIPVEQTSNCILYLLSWLQIEIKNGIWQATTLLTRRKNVGRLVVAFTLRLRPTPALWTQ